LYDAEKQLTKALPKLAKTSTAAAGQRAEHYEIGAYGTVIAWARAMGHDEAVSLLTENLNEEKAADKKLTSLAEGVNEVV